MRPKTKGRERVPALNVVALAVRVVIFASPLAKPHEVERLATRNQGRHSGSKTGRPFSK